MNIFNEQLNEVENYFLDNDLNLGYRRIIDLILDLGRIEFYKKIISYSDLYYDESSSDETKRDNALQLLAELKQESPPNYQEDENLISIQDLEKTYLNRKFQLHPISFKLKSREIIGLVGENGNGKTTLLRLICGELRPTSGQISYHFTEFEPFSFELRTQLVYVPQRIEEMYGSLMDNLQFLLTSYGIDKEENKLLAEVMLARLGLWPYKELKWKELSSGYKMRFELTRTLLRKPKILLLDEPLANLDIMAQQVILEDLRFLSQSISSPFGVILSSQQLYEVEKVSTEVLFLKQGKVHTRSVTDVSDQETIIEIEVNGSKEELQKVLSSLNLKQLKFNGGSYIAYFGESITINDIFLVVGKSSIEIKYIRDISKSSRRFFVN